MGRYLISAALCAIIVLVVAEVAQICVCSNSSSILSRPCVKRERQALVEFKASVHDPSNWLSSWQGVHCCQWEGIGCDNVTGHVVMLDLSTPDTTCWRSKECYDASFYSNGDQYVEAANVDPSLLQLEYLTYLDLSGNHFNYSPIPMFIGSMQRLRHLSLSNAYFRGRIPQSLGNLTNLHFLDLSGIYASETNDINWISGLRSLEHLDMSGVYIGKAHNLFQVLYTLPSLSRIYLVQCGLDMLLVPRVNLTNAPKLQVLSISDNGLNVSHLDALQNMTSLVHLDLSWNYNLNSVVPLWFGNFEKIEYLDLSLCGFHGPIPDAIRNMAFIEFLDLSMNYFTSSVPSWFVELKALLYLDLSTNKLTSMECSLSSILSNMCHLKYLDFSSNNFQEESIFGRSVLSTCIKYDLEIIYLSNNNFSDRLPSWLEKFENLRELVLRENLFYGPIPFSFKKFSKLKKLDLSNNKLEGTLPSSMGQLVSLTYLDLSNNCFNNTIPQSLGQLSSVQNLDLSNNCFNCTIPQSFCQLVNLSDLNLSNNSLKGTIPESLGQLVNLGKLDLSNNYLKGVIPKNLSQLVNLVSLDLSNNYLKGTILESLDQLVQLEILYLSRNKLYGSIPIGFGQLENLLALDLSSNNLNGTMSMGKEWSSIMPELSSLNLANNQISGSLPEHIGHIIPNLDTLILGNNLINGSIPNSLCQIRLWNLDLSKNKLIDEIPNCWKRDHNWEEINLSSNKLSGVFPSSFLNLSSLLWLHLNENNLQGVLPVSVRNMKSLLILDVGENQLVGRFPSWTANTFPSLQILRLRQNNLTGGIPSQLCQLSSLRILDLSRNNLQGSIPRCIGNLRGMILNKTIDENFDPNNNTWSDEHVKEIMKGREFEFIKILELVVTMDLSENNLVGIIPDGITLLNGLHGLNLSNNHFVGEIPKMIGDMKSLESFDVSNNQLSGRIPYSMPALTSLSHLNLSHNNFSGPIPTDNQFSTYDPSVYAGNPYLCGHSLPKKCPGDDDSRQVPSSGGFEDKDGKTDMLEKWGFYFVVAAGFAVGFWGVIGVLYFKRNWRHAYFRWAEDVADTIYVEIALKVAKLKNWLARNRELAN